MEINSLIFRSDKSDMNVTNIYVFAEGIVIFNIEKVEDRIIGGIMGDPVYLIAQLNDGTNIDIQSLYKLDSFTFKGKNIKVEKDTAPGSNLEKKLTKFYESVPGSGFGDEQHGIS